MKKLSGKYITVPLVRRVIGMPGHSSSRFNSCVGFAVAKACPKGSGKSRMDVKTAFKSAAGSCKGIRNK